LCRVVTLKSAGISLADVQSDLENVGRQRRRHSAWISRRFRRGYLNADKVSKSEGTGKV